MSDVSRLLMATLGSLIVLVAGILWQFKKGAVTWIKFISSLGLRKKLMIKTFYVIGLLELSILLSGP